MKASLIKSLAFASGLACLTALSVGPAVAGDQNMAETAKTRTEVRAEYLQAMREGTLPNTGEMDESTYRAMSPKGPATRGIKTFAQSAESGTSLAGGSLSATASPPNSLTREAVRADTREWLRLHRGDVQMGGQ